MVWYIWIRDTEQGNLMEPRRPLYGDEAVRVYAGQAHADMSGQKRQVEAKKMNQID